MRLPRHAPDAADKMGVNYKIEMGMIFRYERCPELRQENAIELIATSSRLQAARQSDAAISAGERFSRRLCFSLYVVNGALNSQIPRYVNLHDAHLRGSLHVVKRVPGRLRTTRLYLDNLISPTKTKRPQFILVGFPTERSKAFGQSHDALARRVFLMKIGSPTVRFLRVIDHPIALGRQNFVSQPVFHKPTTRHDSNV